MRAAYVTTYDSSDVRAWSGLGYHIARCVELAGIKVERIGPLARHIHPLARVRQLEAKLQRRGYPLDRDPHVTRAYSAQVERQLESVPCDLLFSPGTIPIAHIRKGRPIAFWTGATFGAMVHFYPDYSSLSKRAIRVGLDLDTRALERASVAFYASEWASRSAVEFHGGGPREDRGRPIWGQHAHLVQPRRGQRHHFEATPSPLPSSLRRRRLDTERR